MAKRDWVEEPAIQKIFKEHPIMAQLVMAESSGNPDAINKKSGAVGLAQLMPDTAKGGKDSKGRKTYAHGMYGKTLTDAEMRDPVKNLKFASEYLTALKKTFGNTEDALRAYNWGPGAVKEWIKQGRSKEKLPKETRNYVKKIRSRAGQPSPFVTAASAAERKRRGRPTEGVDPSAEARQLRLIKAKILKDRGEDKMATPAQIRRLEKEIQMDKKLGMSKKLLASKQARLRKMKGTTTKPVRAAKPDPKEKLITSSKTGEREKPSNIVSQAEKLLKKDRPSSKVVSSVVRDAMAKDKARKATGKKTAAIASMVDAPGSGKTRAARKVTKPTLAEQRLAEIQKQAATRKKERDRLKTIKKPTKKEIKGLELIKPGAAAARQTERAKAAAANIPYTLEGIGKAREVAARHPTARINKREQEARLEAKKKRRAIAKAKIRAGEFADTKVIKSDSYRGARRGPDTGGLPLKDAMHIGTRVKREKRKPISQLMDAPSGGKRIFPDQVDEPVGTVYPHQVDEPVGTVYPHQVDEPVGTVRKQPKTTSADLHADAPKPGMGFDAALAARKAGPKKKKVTEKRIADDVEGYDPVTGRPSGEDAPKEYSFKDLLGSLDITRADDEPEYESRKHGGKVSKTKKKAKSRKRAALRGWGKALRGY